MNDLTDEELFKYCFDTFVYDIECYHNYFLILFEHVETGKFVRFKSNSEEPANLLKLNFLVESALLVGFNVNGYDNYMLKLALKGFDTELLKGMSDQIINNNLRGRDLIPLYGIDYPNWNTVDIKPLCEAKKSLKTLGARLHCKKLQELPYDPSAYLSESQMDDIERYCENDLAVTKDLIRALLPDLNLRMKMGARYNLDLRSKSRAQIAEVVIKKIVREATGRTPVKAVYFDDYSFKFNPHNISFCGEELNSILKKICDHDFKLNPNTQKTIPVNYKCYIRHIAYKLGIGGLHSQDCPRALNDENGSQIIDCDVVSYYPREILVQELYPDSVGPLFLDIYRDFFQQRMDAIAHGDEDTKDIIKIILNGSYGKFGDPYSFLYSPALLVQVTLTGQLSLLMLIEALAINDFDVISANTDGITTVIAPGRIDLYKKIVAWWVEMTKFEVKFTNYTKLYMRDVNNYFALTSEGKIKRKGIFTKSGLDKNPKNEIIYDAVVDYAIKGVPIIDTILNCKDVTKFLTLTQVKGGAMQNGEHIGKTVRFYHVADCLDTINYISNGNLVPDSTGCRPLMNLDGFPVDIDYSWYIKEAEELLFDVRIKRKKLSLFQDLIPE